MIAPPEAGLGRRRGWALPHFGTKAEERQSIERKSGGNRGPVTRVSAPAASWCDPVGGSPAQVRGSVRLVASVARPLATAVTKRTQRLHGVWD
jgi:hypothetical protein